MPSIRLGECSSTLRFVCKGCQTPLILQNTISAVSGPCPKCATWIDASEFHTLDAPVKTLSTSVPERGSRNKRGYQNVIGGKGRMRADGYLDHGYNERRELFGTLRVMAVSLAVLAVILFITLYLKHWMSS